MSRPHSSALDSAILLRHPAAASARSTRAKTIIVDSGDGLNRARHDDDGTKAKVKIEDLH
jgi:hypothetical protein